VTVPFQKMFWGDRWGLLTDPFGLMWAIGEPAEAG
jgi:PhnB protein